MTHDDLLKPLHLFLSQSQQLLALAEAGDWETFETLLQERQQGTAAIGDNSLLIAVTKADLADEMRTLLAEIQTTNNRVAEIAQTSRAEIAIQLRQLLQAEKAIDAYKK